MADSTAALDQLPIDAIVWDPSIYPRAKWSTSTIDRYVDALEAGDTFPPVVVEAGSRRLLDGRHRQLAYVKAGLMAEAGSVTVTETVDGEEKQRRLGVFIPAAGSPVAIQERTVPEGMTARYYAATLSARHGDRMSNGDLKALAEAEFEADPTLTQTDWGRRLGVSSSTVSRWVSHITERERRSRASKAWRLTQLGWKQDEAGERLGVSQAQVSKDIQESHLGNLNTVLGANWNDKRLAQEADRLDLPLADAWAAALYGQDDEARLKALGVKVQPYDVWQFPSCHDLMGDRHPGRIPGELVAHALYFLTDPGDLVVDPMAGSGTTLDACLLMGRKARGYDIDHRHDRVDVEQHNLDNGWPDSVGNARLIFWDPPYFDKMDHGTIGDDGYIDGSISGLDPDGYLDWFAKRFDELHSSVQPGTRLAFLMSDWDPENAKRYQDHRGIYLWDYVDRLRDAGWTMRRQVQCPLSTQQVHPDIVNKFRASRRLARLERYLLVAEA